VWVRHAWGTWRNGVNQLGYVVKVGVEEPQDEKKKSKESKNRENRYKLKGGGSGYVSRQEPIN